MGESACVGGERTPRYMSPIKMVTHMKVAYEEDHLAPTIQLAIDLMEFLSKTR